MCRGRTRANNSQIFAVSLIAGMLLACIGLLQAPKCEQQCKALGDAVGGFSGDSVDLIIPAYQACALP